jgi:TonB-linked SusC/RagA family outer membrane protein
MKRRLFSLGAIALLVPLFHAGAQAPGAAESGRITGSVTATEGGAPIQGAQVVVVGTRYGTTTREDGRFTIILPAGSYRVRATMLGFAPQMVIDVPVTTATPATVDFTLTRQAVMLSETVVVGYGTQSRKDVTGAVAQVSAVELAQTPKLNVVDAMKGRVAGVDIVSTGYKPGDGVQVRIRGTRSLKAGNDPLYVLDGIPMDGGLNDLNPSDIESVDVLKDASATAIYGSRGANGVILITTKKGEGDGRARITYDTYVGQSEALRKIEMLNGEEFVEMRREAKKTVGKYLCPAGVASCDAGDKDMLYPIEYEMYKAGRYTDWQDVLLRQGAQSSHQLSVQGGNDRTQYAVSGSLTDQEGIVRGQDFDRKSMRVNIESQATGRLRIGGSALVMRSTQNLGRGDGVYSEALQNSPLGPAFDSTGKMIFRPTPDGQRVNPLADVANFLDRRQRTRAFGTLFTSLRLFEGVDWRVNFGPDIAYNTRGQFRGSETQANFGSGAADALQEEDRGFTYTLDNIVNVRRQLGRLHRIDGTLLYSIQQSWDEEHDTSVDGLPYEHQLFYNLGTGDQVLSVRSDKREWALQSYMGRLNYALADRYLFTVTTRVDGSSRLAPGRKWATFPSVALGWLISEEPFMMSQKYFSNLKLRASYGRAGNTSVDPYQTQGLLSRTTYIWDNAPAFGYRPGALANKNLEWEKTDQYDVGLEFGLFRDRLSGTVDYYRAFTHDLLMDRQLPASTGFTSTVQNIGETKNTGVELGLSALVLENWKGLRWSVDGNWTRNKNEIVSLYGGKDDDLGNRWFIGMPIDDNGNNRIWYTHKFGGIWQQADAALAATYGHKPGMIRPVDINEDGKIDDFDRVILGTTYPKWTGSLSTRLEWKSLDFSAMAITRQGFMVSNAFLTTHDRLDARYNNVKRDYWTPTNPSNVNPQPNYDQEGPINGGLRGFEDGSFTKIRNITLGYTVGNRYLSRVGAEALRIYGTAQDPFMFTKSSVLDPEGRTSAGSPSYRTLLVGASVTF